MRHVTHGAASCVAAVREGKLPLADPVAVAAANVVDKADRACRRKAGLRDHLGPPVIRPAARELLAAARELVPAA